LVHSHFAGLAALAAAHQDRSACRIKVAFGQRQRFAHAQPGAPRHDEQSAQAQSVCRSPGAAHDTTKGHSDRASEQTLDRLASNARRSGGCVVRRFGCIRLLSKASAEVMPKVQLEPGQMSSPGVVAWFAS
jgi:hypothetical protein